MKTTRTCWSCGYTAEYASIPMADAHHPKHSCSKHRLAVERAARRSHRARTRATRECVHAPSQHVHGTRAAYVRDSCRCTDCTVANTAASRTTNRLRAYGRWQPLVDAGPVHEHLIALRAAGIGVERIATFADMSVSHVRELAAPSRAHRRIRPSTASQLLSIGVDDANRAPHSRVDATGTHRRLQALIAIGWSPEMLVIELDRCPRSLRRSMVSPSVTARTAQEVANLYQRMSNTPPPRDTGAQRDAAHAALIHAVAHQWLPPLAWDDIDTDVQPPPAGTRRPGDDVDEIAVERAMAADGVQYADLTAAEQTEVVRRLTERGRSLRDIAAQLATTTHSVSRQRAAADSTAPGRRR